MHLVYIYIYIYIYIGNARCIMVIVVKNDVLIFRSPDGVY